MTLANSIISNYQIVRRDRKHGASDDDTESRGRVCFYVRNNINFSPRLDLSIDQLENVCIEIRNPSSKPFLVMTWYRPPNSTIDKLHLFENLIGRLDSENVEYYLLGDVNCNMGASVFDHETKVLSSIADLYSLHQLIQEPTRITESSSTMMI